MVALSEDLHSILQSFLFLLCLLSYILSKRLCCVEIAHSVPVSLYLQNLNSVVYIASDVFFVLVLYIYIYIYIHFHSLLLDLINPVPMEF